MRKILTFKRCIDGCDFALRFGTLSRENALIRNIGIRLIFIIQSNFMKCKIAHRKPHV
jgi:hypothetical protein